MNILRLNDYHPSVIPDTHPMIVVALELNVVLKSSNILDVQILSSK